MLSHFEEMSNFYYLVKIRRKVGKAWDLVRVRREIRKSASVSKKRSKNNCLFFVLVIAVFLISVAFFSQANVNGFSLSAPSKSALPTAKPSATKDLTPTLKIINGSGKFEETDQISTLVKTAGFKVTATETAPNLYNQTIVYYKPAYESEAGIIVAALKDFNAKNQPFSQDSTYDLAIIVGVK